MLKNFDYNSKTLFFSTILGLLALNIVLKLSYLDYEPFWYDESISVKSTFSDFGHIKHEADWDNNPPFYYYCIWVWVKLFGISEFKVRLLSVLFSSLSSVLLFTFSRKVFSYITAISAALLFSFHNYLYEYSHEARSYSLVILLVIISGIVFFKFLEKHNYLNVFFLGLINFLIAYTHYLAALTLLLQLIFVITFFRYKIKFLSISLFITFVFIFIRFTKKQFLTIFSFDSAGKSFWLKKADFELFTETLQNLLCGKEIYLILLAILIISILSLFFKKNYQSILQKQVLIYSFYIGILSFTFLFLLGRLTPVFHSRYLAFTVPYFLVLISWGLTNTGRIVGVFIPLIIFFQFFFIKLNPPKNMDFRTAAKVVTELSGKTNPFVILQTKDITGLFTYYYDRSIFMDYKHLNENLAKKNIYDIRTLNDFNSLNYKNQSTIIFCQTYEQKEDSKLIFELFKANHFVYVTSTAVRGVKISLLRKLY